MITITDKVDAWDCLEIASIMRDADIAEIYASSGKEPLEVLINSLAVSTESYLACYRGLPVAVFGVVPADVSYLTDPKVGIVWMLTTEVVRQCPKAFWQECKRGLRLLLERWDVLLNAVDCRHEKALRWGSRLGFVFEPPESFGVHGLPFQRFSVTKEVCCV